MQSWNHVPPESVVTFPEGIPGLAGARKFVILRSEEMEPISVLQAIEDEHVSLPVIPVHAVDGDYRIALSAQDRKTLAVGEGQNPSSLVCLAVLILPGAETPAACNLLAPIVINPASMRGKQVVQINSSYSALQPLEAA
ncbi:MAG: flagellar assembly protein FliW [Bryobacterales bacterium]